ncbi:MAG TPA: hypothetical protein VHC42_05835 [Rhizomicrobium sp.]|nr:hypothetical protein [Rhizomicrobium sp.]
MARRRYGAISAKLGGRMAGVCAVILVHALLIAFVLSGLPKLVAVPRGPHELIMMLVSKPAPQKASRKTVSRPKVPSSISHSPYSAPKTMHEPSAPNTLAIPELGCAPENLGKLSAEEQAKCGDFGVSPPDKTAIAGFRSHVRDPELHAAELAARKAPARVDCTRTVTRVIMNIAQDNGVMVDTRCALGLVKRALGR